MSSKEEFEFLGFFATLAALALFGTFLVLWLPFALVGGAAFLGGYIWYNHPARKEKQQRQLTLELYEETLKRYEGITPHWTLSDRFRPAAQAIFDAEVASGSVEPPPTVCNSIEGARYRDRLSKLGSVNQEKVDQTVSIIEGAFRYVDYPDLPYMQDVPLSYLLKDMNQSVEDVMMYFQFADGFWDMKREFQRNFEEAKEVYPSDYKGDDVVYQYLKGTPLLDIFNSKVPFGFPKEKYFQHCLITAGTGGGKSQLIQWFIKHEMLELLDGNCSIIVMDSQRSLIDALLAIDFPKEKVVYIDPRDVEYPIPISFFDMGLARASGYSGADQEQMVNKAIEVLSFVIGGILGAEMTTKQGTLFNFVIRLLIEIPHSTLHTMVDVMKNGVGEYWEYIDKLSPVAQNFFEEEYDNDRQYAQTREQVVRRLYDVLQVSVFERMFSSPTSKFDLFSEMNAGKLILLDTNKDLLQKSGTQLLGRLYLAMLNIAIQERVLVQDRKPVYFFCDELRDYLEGGNEGTVTDLLEQARKMNVGTFWVTQQLGQLSTSLKASFMANTSIKMCTHVSHGDATSLAKEMRTSVDFINAQPELSFATFVKGVTGKALPLNIPYGSLSGFPRREDMDDLRTYMRETYGYRPGEEPPYVAIPDVEPPDDLGGYADDGLQEIDEGIDEEERPEDREGLNRMFGDKDSTDEL